MRKDVFIIWGNGLNHSDEIIEMIDKEYKIFFIKDIVIDNMQQFLNDIYKCDTVPNMHLHVKSKYLLKAPLKAIFILVENSNVNEQYVGTGEYRHIQCVNINDFKGRVREKFNPKHPDPNFQAGNLPAGLSHDHVIHATDYASQVDYLLKFFKYPTNIERTKLDCRNFFYGMPNYAIIRSKEWFPMYQTYRDIDFLCEDLNAVKKHILNQAKGDFRINPSTDKHTIHVDYYFEGKLDLKFDFVDKLDYTYINQEEFSKKVLDNKIKKHNLYYANDIHDEFIKGLEYIKLPHKKQYQAQGIKMQEMIRNKTPLT